MEKEFIPYKQALALKELGFDEPCFAFYTPEKQLIIARGDILQSSVENAPSTPLYQQAFRWLYQKLDIEKGVMPLDIESQQLLLKELIDKVSSKHLLV